MPVHELQGWRQVLEVRKAELRFEPRHVLQATRGHDAPPTPVDRALRLDPLRAVRRRWRAWAVWRRRLRDRGGGALARRLWPEPAPDRARRGDEPAEDADAAGE